MRLDEDIAMTTTDTVVGVEKKNKKDKKAKKLLAQQEDALQTALKKPRTRAVSLTLSENGIDEEMSQLSAKHTVEKQPKEKKSKKSKNADENEAPSPESPKVKKKEKKEKKIKDQNGTTVVTPVINGDEVPAEHEAGRFSNFPIREETIKRLKAKGIKYLFPIQVETYKQVLEGQDTIAKARTGTGKTLAFALPLIEKLEGSEVQKRRGRPPRVIVLAPTRELANQVANDFKALSSRGLRIEVFYGGVPMHNQGDALRSGIDILVGTPGRVLDWVNKGALDTSSLEHVVLDEVDQMLDMGFAEDVENIISASYHKEESQNPQTLFFSATLPSWVTRTAKKYMKTMPKVIDLVGQSVNQTSTSVSHLALKVYWSEVPVALARLIQYYSGDNGRAMVFCETKKDVDLFSMCDDIKQNKEKLHGDVKQETRERVLEQFRQGKVKVLVTTNVAARGIDIPEVDLVIQTNPPTDIDSYIHRSGRTGRAGKSGISICLYNNRNEHDLNRVARFANLSFKRINVPSPDDLLNSGMKDMLSSVDAISDEVIEKFKPMAQELIDSKGSHEAVAALLALVTGQTTIEQRSLITNREGSITLLYRTNATINYKGFVYTVLRQRCPEIDQQIHSMTLCKDKKGAVFDVDTANFEKYKSQLVFESHQDSIVRATSLPEIEQSGGGGHQSGGRGGGRRGGYNNSSPRGGYNNNSSQGGYNNRSPRGGFRGGYKRSFGGDSSSGAPSNKIVKFD